jgi:monoamine oxidase
VDASGPSSAAVEPLRARALVVAVPAAVLKAPDEGPGAISFDPPLRRLERDLSMIETGHVVKVVLRFRERFWDDEGWQRARIDGPEKLPPLNFLHLPDAVLPTWWTPSPFRAPVLTGWSGGPGALALAAGGEAAIVDAALDVLSRAFRERRSRLERILDATSWHDWDGDPFARGAYSYLAVGGRGAQKRLSTPFEGTIFIAGEATSADETGTVSGAIASGARAATQVRRALARR